MIRLALGILVVAAVSTASDYTWYEAGVRHQMVAGIITGAVMLMAVGGVVGWMGRRTVSGMGLGVVAGVIGALAYYALAASSLRQWAMLSAWAIVWLVLAIGDGRILQRGRVSWAAVLARGVAAAALSGLTFYVMSDDLWGRAPAGGRNYAMQFARWVVAWAPGLIAIVWPPRRR